MITYHAEFKDSENAISRMGDGDYVIKIHPKKCRIGIKYFGATVWKKTKDGLKFVGRSDFHQNPNWVLFRAEEMLPEESNWIVVPGTAI